MISISSKITDRGLTKKLKAASAACKGNDQRVRGAFRAVGVMALRDAQQDYREAAAGRGQWPQVSPVTVLQRRRGRGAKIEDWKDIDRRRGEMEILRSSGRLMNSLSPGAPGNVLKVAQLSVEVGTNVRYAATHQRGKSSRFEFDEAAFERNVKKVRRGSKPRKTRTGRRSRAKRNWNPMYFQARNWLRKLDGKRFRVPKRVIIARPSASRRRAYAQLLRTALKRSIG